MAKQSLILVDGSSYLFRAYHALPPLINSAGMPTGAIYGVLNMLRKLLHDYAPTHIAVIFDPKGKTFRHHLYPAYKANRTQMPEELQVQIAPLHQAIQALGLPLVVVNEVEADDVIATLAKQAEQTGFNTLIISGDKDLTQLVNPCTILIDTMQNRTLDQAGVMEKFSVTPEQMIDYLSLIGDSSDNIPGIPKVGPKTAVKWLAEYGSLAQIIQQADNIGGVVGANLRAHLPQLPLTRQLLTVKTDLNLPVTPRDLVPAPKDYKELQRLFTQFEFKSWLKELDMNSLSPEQAATHPPVTAATYSNILSPEDFSHWQERLKHSAIIALDTETTSLDAMRAKLVGVSFAVQSGEAAYLPLQHDYPGAPPQLALKPVIAFLKKLLHDPHKIIVGQNLKYDLKVLANHGIDLNEVRALLWDSLLASYILNSHATRHDLDTLALHFLGHQNITYQDVAGKGAKALSFNQVTLEKAMPYAAEDADIALQLYQALDAKLQAIPSINAVFKEIELPLMPILTLMEYHGVLIDTQRLKQQSEELGKRLAELAEETYNLAGETFNLSSPLQLQAILFDKLQLPIIKKTPKGQPSTAEDVLQELAHHYPLPKLILEYRSLAKLKSTYLDSLPLQVNPQTGRVHTSYRQAVTVTGRLSSQDPNLQNIPVRSQEGRKIRRAFIAPPQHRLIAADYSQVELRIMAHFSQDPGLIYAFEHGLDVHSQTAAEVFNISLDAVTPEERRRAKAINFGLMYGMSSFGLAKQLGISRREADEHIAVYFARYPKVHAYMEEARQQASRQGFVETLFGRRVQVPDINSHNIPLKNAALRAAINAPLQGTAADIIKRAMIEVQHWLHKSKIPAVMIMQVHDELVFEVHQSVLQEAKQAISERMENAAQLRVPLIVDIGDGENWDEAH